MEELKGSEADSRRDDAVARVGTPSSSPLGTRKRRAAHLSDEEEEAEVLLSSIVDVPFRYRNAQSIPRRKLPRADYPGSFLGVTRPRPHGFLDDLRDLLGATGCSACAEKGEAGAAEGDEGPEVEVVEGGDCAPCGGPCLRAFCQACRAARGPGDEAATTWYCSEECRTGRLPAEVLELPWPKGGEGGSWKENGPARRRYLRARTLREAASSMLQGCQPAGETQAALRGVDHVFVLALRR
jgi:hypothetical protein